MPSQQTGCFCPTKCQQIFCQILSFSVGFCKIIWTGKFSVWYKAVIICKNFIAYESTQKILSLSIKTEEQILSSNLDIIYDKPSLLIWILLWRETVSATNVWFRDITRIGPYGKVSLWHLMHWSWSEVILLKYMDNPTINIFIFEGNKILHFSSIYS